MRKVYSTDKLIDTRKNLSNRVIGSEMRKMFTLEVMADILRICRPFMSHIYNFCKLLNLVLPYTRTCNICNIEKVF